MVALAAVLALGIALTAVISFSSSNQRSADLGQANQTASQLAESGLESALSILHNGSPTDATALGCSATDGSGGSDCSSYKASWPLCVAVLAHGACTTGDAGTASVYGFYGGGTNSTGVTFDGRTAQAQQWVIVSKGFANDTGAAGVRSELVVATVKVTSGGQNPASYWNHIFSSASPQPGVCELNINGNQQQVDVPVYALGDVCLSGNQSSIQETTQPVDLMVGGQLIYSGNQSGVGTAGHKLTSGVVVGGCASSLGGASTPCGNGNWDYHVNSLDTFVQNDAPSVSASDEATDYANADPGPKHPCQSGGLAASTWDNDATQNNSVAAVFDLTPSSSYTCVSQSGSGTGELSWNAGTHQLTINGTIFIDGSMKATHTATYTGSAVIYLAGTFTMANSNQISLCASSGCNFNAWQGNSGNNSMLTIAPLASSGTGFSLAGANQDKLQLSIYCQPGAMLDLGGNQINVQGPVVCGRFNWGNQLTLQPLPSIKNMPPGAPLPPSAQTPAQLGPAVYQ